MIDPSKFKIQNWQEPVFTVVGDQLYKLTQPFIISWQTGPFTEHMVIPAGDESDGASTPPWTAVLGITPAGLDFGPAVAHDLLYRYQGVLPVDVYQQLRNGAWENMDAVWSRPACDAFLKTLLLAAGVSRWQAWTMYLAVRACGWAFWRRLFLTAAK